MKKVLKGISTYVIITSILALVLGIVFVAFHFGSLVALDIILGVYLVIQGIVMIILGIRALIKHLPVEGIVPGILSLILGVLFLENIGTWAALLGIVLGIWLIVQCISGIRLATNLRGTGAPWVLLVILNVIGIMAGAFVIFAPASFSVAYTWILGIVLIVNAIINIIDMIIVKKFVKVAGDEIEAELEDVVQEAVQQAEKAAQAQNTVEPVEAAVIEEAPAAEETAPADDTAEL